MISYISIFSSLHAISYFYFTYFLLSLLLHFVSSFPMILFNKLNFFH